MDSNHPTMNNMTWFEKAQRSIYLSRKKIQDYIILNIILHENVQETKSSQPNCLKEAIWDHFRAKEFIVEAFK